MAFAPAPGGGSLAAASMTADLLAGDVYERLRRVQADGASVVDALLAFMRERAALEESYSKQLAKLSRQSLALNGGYRAVVLLSKPCPMGASCLRSRALAQGLGCIQCARV